MSSVCIVLCHSFMFIVIRMEILVVPRSLAGSRHHTAWAQYYSDVLVLAELIKIIAFTVQPDFNPFCKLELMLSSKNYLFDMVLFIELWVKKHVASIQSKCPKEKLSSINWPTNVRKRVKETEVERKKKSLPSSLVITWQRKKDERWVDASSGQMIIRWMCDLGMKTRDIRDVSWSQSCFTFNFKVEWYVLLIVEPQVMIVYFNTKHLSAHLWWKWFQAGLLTTMLSGLLLQSLIPESGILGNQWVSLWYISSSFLACIE